MTGDFGQIAPFPLRAAPAPWEDLASVLSRTARRMGYPNPLWVLQPETLGQKISPADLPTLTEDGDYRMLTSLLGLSEKQLTELTLHRFLSRIKKQILLNKERLCATGNFSFGSISNLFTYTGQTIRVCPCCLDEPDSYDRLYWRVTSDTDSHDV